MERGRREERNRGGGDSREGEEEGGGNVEGETEGCEMQRVKEGKGGDSKPEGQSFGDHGRPPHSLPE